MAEEHGVVKQLNSWQLEGRAERKNQKEGEQGPDVVPEACTHPSNQVTPNSLSVQF